MVWLILKYFFWYCYPNDWKVLELPWEQAVTELGWATFDSQNAGWIGTQISRLQMGVFLLASMSSSNSDIAGQSVLLPTVSFSLILTTQVHENFAFVISNVFIDTKHCDVVKVPCLTAKLKAWNYGFWDWGSRLVSGFCICVDIRFDMWVLVWSWCLRPEVKTLNGSLRSTLTLKHKVKGWSLKFVMQFQ